MPTPCWIGRTAMASSVTTIRPNSARLRRQTSSIVAARTMRWATKSSTPAERRVRHVGEQAGAERRERKGESGADERAELRHAAGLRDNRGARRAGVDGKGADQPGDADWPRQRR